MPNLISNLEIRHEIEAACPTNGKAGRRVDTQIVKAMLNLPLNVLRNVEYRFCPDPNCPTVYYSADGSQTFTEADLRERVYQKHPQDADVFVCYCFRHTLGEILAEGQRVAAEINLGIKNGQCACDIRNPQGSCCLGNVNAIVKRALGDASVIQ
ncbi:MAG: hypothetical protein AB1509_08590 [Chloroflexota bacterium]